VPKVNEAERWLHRRQRRLERLRRLAEIYGPYIELDCVFDDREAVALWHDLAPDDRERLPFDTEQVEWSAYLHDIHLPALRALVRSWRPTAPAARAAGHEELADGPPGLAFFDVEGVVLATTVVHFYAWLRGRTMPRGDRELWLASLAARAPGYLRLDRDSRAEFTRSFYRSYRGLPAAELRAHTTECLSEFILPRIQHAAVRRIRAHRRRGDRVVLVTGALDFLVEPLRHLGDRLVAARLVERDGAFTGELAEPVATADGRAALAAQIAEEHGVALADCHAYADSISDLPMLELVGHAHAVNPDFRLAREARRKGWPVLKWDAEAA
jgi:HAD superfamily hydrolase (TIGR01490 family)